MKNPPLIRFTLTLRGLLIILLIGALLFSVVIHFGLFVEKTAQPTATIIPSTATQTRTATATSTFTRTITPTVTLTPTITDTYPVIGSLGQGLMVMAIDEGGYSHLFAYQPQSLPLTRLTNHAWDDITPALSPDGHKVAYSSRQNGYWDLYVLDLTSGVTTRLTDDPAYQADPSWSPDGKWLVYDQYQEGGNWDIYILSVDDPSQTPTQLTNDQAMENSPDWSSQGRMIAYVSNSSGNADIWVANLDNTEDRFKDISNTPASSEAHPAWSPNGNQLAWSSTSDGISNIYIWNRLQPDTAPRLVGNGNWPIWSPDGKLIITSVEDPNHTFLIAYQSDTGAVLMPLETLPGSLHGMAWSSGKLPDPLPSNLTQIQTVTPTPLWDSTLIASTAGISGRQGIVSLGDVTAPYPSLEDSVAGSFQALRKIVADEIGWDFLADLENAFVPLNNPLPPGDLEDWLYTGRSIQVNSVPIDAGWMFVVREDFNDQTYWRVYLKVRYQDGSQGVPVDQLAWDLNSRYSGNAAIYEEGGQLSTSLPSGYWLDFTDLALSYGWERLPSLVDWRTYFEGIRFNQFVLRGNLDWTSAMLEIYPAEILITPTPILPPSDTPTRTPQWMTAQSSTPTLMPTTTSTLRPTWTPSSP